MLAVVIVDLLEILRRAPRGQFTTFINNQCIQLIDELGRGRSASLLGFSSGGLTALAPARALESIGPLPVWLLDTYHPETELSLLVNRTVRPAIRTLLRSRLLAKVTHTRVRAEPPPTVVPVYPMGSIEYVRERTREDLLGQTPALPTGRAHLVQRLKTARGQLIPFKRRTNGFAQAYFKCGTIRRIDCARGKF